MIRNRVLPLQLASLLVTISTVLIVSSTNAYAYIQHDEDEDAGIGSYYYDQDQARHHYPNSAENTIEDDHDPKPVGYSYQYQVHSPQTGDYKTQHEERIGDTVRGSYSLIEPDGTRRIVEYTADPRHGFRAVVKREPTGVVLPNQPPSHSHSHSLSQPHGPKIVQPKPITKPPPILRPTPIRPPQPVKLKYPIKLFHTGPQYQAGHYQTTSAPKVRYSGSPSPSKYSLFRFHGWPFVY